MEHPLASEYSRCQISCVKMTSVWWLTRWWPWPWLGHCRHSSTICCSSYTPANQQANLLYCQVLYSSPTIKPTRPLLLFSYIAICWTPTLPLESVIPKTTLLAGLQFYPYIHSDVGGRGQLIQDIYQSMTRNIF